MFVILNPKRMGNVMWGRRSQAIKQTTYLMGVVSCPKCASPIRIKLQKSDEQAWGLLDNEFSAQCKKCRNRGIFSRNEMTTESLPERRKKPRK